MKRNEVKVLLAITVLSVGMAMTGCGNKSSEIVSEPTQIEEVIETTPEVTPEPTQGVVDGNLDETMAGTYYIITEDQNLYKECNQASEVVDTLPIDSEIIVSGLYGDTGLFQVVDADGVILGYVDSAFCDTVKGGYIPEDTTESTTEPADTTTTSEGIGLTEEDLGITQEELNKQIQDALNEQAESTGRFGGWVPEGDATFGDGTPAVIAGDSPMGDGSGLTKGVVLD